LPGFRTVSCTAVARGARRASYGRRGHGAVGTGRTGGTRAVCLGSARHKRLPDQARADGVRQAGAVIFSGAERCSGASIALCVTSGRVSREPTPRRADSKAGFPTIVRVGGSAECCSGAEITDAILACGARREPESGAAFDNGVLNAGQHALSVTERGTGARFADPVRLCGTGLKPLSGRACDDGVVGASWFAGGGGVCFELARVAGRAHRVCVSCGARRKGTSRTTGNCVSRALGRAAFAPCGPRHAVHAAIRHERGVCCGVCFGPLSGGARWLGVTLGLRGDRGVRQHRDGEQPGVPHAAPLRCTHQKGYPIAFRHFGPLLAGS
jgi:hypothetical protein